MPELPRATQRLIDAVGIDEAAIMVFPEGTKTAEDAANAIGCPVSAIVKSLVFMVEEEPVVALVPGDKLLDTDALSAAAGGGQVRRAGLDEVRESTGYSAGGTPPFGHTTELRVFADPSLKRNDPVWAAAGTPTSVFPITINALDQLAAPVWEPIT